MSFSNNQITELAEAIDAFDFSLIKSNKQLYTLRITASLNKKDVSRKSIVLNTSDLPTAIADAIEYVKGSLRNDVLPGIRIANPDEGIKLTLNQEIALKPHVDFKEITEGIRIIQENTSGFEDCGSGIVDLIPSIGEDELAAELAEELYNAFNEVFTRQQKNN